MTEERTKGKRRGKKRKLVETTDAALHQVKSNQIPNPPPPKTKFRKPLTDCNPHPSSPISYILPKYISHLTACLDPPPSASAQDDPSSCFPRLDLVEDELLVGGFFVGTAALLLLSLLLVEAVVVVEVVVVVLVLVLVQS